MEMQQFSACNRRRSESPEGFRHALDSWSLSDWLTATMGELGEAANVAKKLNRVRDGIPGNYQTREQLRAMLADELSDTFIYLDLLCQSQGIDLETAVLSKFNRTSRKIGYPYTLPIDTIGESCCYVPRDDDDDGPGPTEVQIF